MATVDEGVSLKTVANRMMIRQRLPLVFPWWAAAPESHESDRAVPMVVMVLPSRRAARICCRHRLKVALSEEALVVGVVATDASRRDL